MKTMVAWMCFLGYGDRHHHNFDSVETVWGVAVGTVLNSGGTKSVSGGIRVALSKQRRPRVRRERRTAIGTVISSGGIESVSSGGTVSNTTVLTAAPFSSCQTA